LRKIILGTTSKADAARFPVEFSRPASHPPQHASGGAIHVKPRYEALALLREREAEDCFNLWKCKQKFLTGHHVRNEVGGERLIALPLRSGIIRRVPLR
jgi:hypothetical protein